MNGLIEILRTTGLSGWVAFAVIYHFGTHGMWRRSRIGPWIMALCFVPLITLIVGVTAMALGIDSGIVKIMRLVLMIILNLMPLWLAVLFVRRQREIGGYDDQPREIHEGDRGRGERGVRPVPAGDDRGVSGR